MLLELLLLELLLLLLLLLLLELLELLLELAREPVPGVEAEPEEDDALAAAGAVLEGAMAARPSAWLLRAAPAPVPVPVEPLAVALLAPA